EYVRGVGTLHDEPQRLGQLLRAPEQRRDLLGRAADRLQVGPGKLERQQQVAILLLVFVQESGARREARSSLALGKQAEEHRRRFAQQVQRLVQLRRPEVLRPREKCNVAAQLLEPVTAGRD